MEIRTKILFKYAPYIYIPKKKELLVPWKKKTHTHTQAKHACTKEREWNGSEETKWDWQVQASQDKPGEALNKFINKII